MNESSLHSTIECDRLTNSKDNDVNNNSDDVEQELLETKSEANTDNKTFNNQIVIVPPPLTPFTKTIKFQNKTINFQNKVINSYN